MKGLGSLMTTRIVCVHGRGQQRKDWQTLRKMWVAGLNQGLTLAGMPAVDPEGVVFPFYGDRIQQFVEKLARTRREVDELQRSVARADTFLPGVTPVDDEVADLQLALLDRFGERVGAPGERPRERYQRGASDWLGKVELIQDGLEWINESAPWVSQQVIHAVTRDVALYLRKQEVREGVLSEVVDRVKNEVPSDQSLILLCHSLGTVVGMDAVARLRNDYRITLLVTCGSPLGIREVYSNLAEQPQPTFPQGIGGWTNAYDPRDVVALEEQLRPLFKGEVIDIRVENGDKPHAIDRYLAHGPVAEPIGRALAVA